MGWMTEWVMLSTRINSLVSVYLSESVTSLVAGGESSHSSGRRTILTSGH